MNYKINRAVKIREAGIIIQSWVLVLIRLFLAKKIKILSYWRSNALTIREIFSLNVLLLANHFILPLTKIRNHI